MENKFYYTISYLSLLLAGNLLLTILLTYDAFAPSLNTVYNHHDTLNTLIFARNMLADTLLQIFGYSIYLLPIWLLIMSLKVYFVQSIKYLKYKFLLLWFSIIVSASCMTYFITLESGGLIGLFLNNALFQIQFVIYVALIILIISIVIAMDLSITNFKNIIFYQMLFLKLFVIKLFKPSYQQPVNYNDNIDKFAFMEEDDEMQVMPDISLMQSQHREQNSKASLISDEPHDAINDQELFAKSFFAKAVYKDQSNNKAKSADNNIVRTVNKERQDTKSLTAKSQNDEQQILMTPMETISSNTTMVDDMLVKSSIKDHEYQIDPTSYYIPMKYLAYKAQNNNISNAEIQNVASILENVLAEFAISGKVVNIQKGPVVTLYEISIPAGVKAAKVIALETDLALRMKATSVRVALIPGKDVLGVEIPNSQRKLIYLKEILQHKLFTQSNANLPIVLGYDINGKPIIEDLATMPHLLIAGTTGSGKSVGVNGMILSLLYKLSPMQCKLIMIDPKMLEFSIYKDIPHLFTPVVTQSKKAITVLKWLVKEMEKRYTLMALVGVRNISNYNDKITKHNFIAPNIPDDDQLLQDATIEFMPYIVVIIDEMADLMMVAGKDVEFTVQRLAQMARAAGIHLIMSTQRPSVDVITGTIKANFPTRISFQVSSKIDSRTILGEAGAEQLLGKGDMLFMSGVGRIKRVHAPFISDDEINNIVDYLTKLAKPQYVTNFEESSLTINDFSDQERDELYSSALDLIYNEGKVSTSYLQRKFQIGYNRAARLIEQLEEDGILSKPNANGKREIINK